MPFFSILMPTRDRAALLEAALKTAVRQDFDDYEIVVSDNNSADETRAVVEDFARSCDKIKYVNPGRDLSMCDSWEYVLNEASGRFVLYLCDDDAFTPDTLPCVHDILTRFPINTLVWRYANYQHPDIPQDTRCMLTYREGSGKLFEVASRPVMDALCNFDASAYAIIPKMLNCVVSREAIDHCVARTGRFFIPPYPDFSSVGQLLSTNDAYHLIDFPLYISGASVVSNAGIVFNRKAKFDSYTSLYGEDMLDGVVYPMKYLTTPYFQATWRLFQRLYPETFTSEINLGSYLKALFAELTKYERYEDISAEFEQIAGYMRDYSGGDEMFDRLWREHRRAADQLSGNDHPSPLGRVKRGVKSVLGKNERLLGLVQRARGVAPPRSQTVSHPGVQSIIEAARILGSAVTARRRGLRVEQPASVTSSNFLQAYR